MSHLHHVALAELLAAHEPPCLSLYQPTHRSHPDNQQDPIRFRNLVKGLEESLRRRYPNREIRPLLAPFLALADDTEFWNHTRDGLAMFGSAGFDRVYLLQRPVAEHVVVADTFHAKPLVRILQSADRYQVLALSRTSYRMYEGNRDVLDEIEPGQGQARTIDELVGDRGTKDAHQGVVSKGAGVVHHGSGSRKDQVDIDTERFFRAVDREVLARDSKPSGLPLILAALTEHQAPFRSVSHNPALLADGIGINPEALAVDDLRRRSWEVVEPQYLARLARLVEEFGTARSRQQGSDDLSTIADAAVAGRVATLLVEADRHDPGRIDRTTGRIAFDDLADPLVDDLLDDLAETVLAKGGDVVVVPSGRMPTKSGAAATFRF